MTAEKIYLHNRMPITTENIDYISFIIPIMMNARALEKIQKEISIKTGKLDLNFCDLYEIPQEISQMAWLTELKLQRNSIYEIQLSDALTNLLYLDLSDNGITKIKGLENLTNLSVLNLSKNNIREITGLGNLINLTRLSLNNNLYIAKIEGLDNLSNLSYLNLGINSIKEIKGIGNLKQLSTLILYRNRIEEISGLYEQKNLLHLDLSENKIKALRGLDSVERLEELDLHNNQITKIENLEKLLQLSSLNLYNNTISEIEGLEKLSNLSDLFLQGNKINKIKGLDKLINLSKLYLRSNSIDEIANLSRLKNLKELDLADNRITELKNLNKLHQLEELNLDGNPIAQLAVLPSLVQKSNFKRLYLFGIKSNDLNIPTEHFGKNENTNCLEALRGYFASIKKGSFQLKELPVILVGNSTAGKTSLRYFLQQNVFPPPEDASTHGIEPSVWIPDEESIENLSEEIKPKDLQLFFWDFGGQEYYHATHRLFFSRKAIYIVVWEKKTNKQSIENINIKKRKPNGKIEKKLLPLELFPYEYWLQSIRYLATDVKESPIILLQNKTDEPGNEEEDPDSELLKTYKYKWLSLSIKKAYEINGEGKKDPLIEILLKKIFSEAKELSTTFRYGSQWENIKKMLQEVSKENIWTIEKFKQEVRLLEPGLQDNSIMLSYVPSLDRIKALLYFEDDELLKDYIFINPGWVAEMIYSILDQDVSDKGGEFNKEHVIKKAGNEYADVFIALMKKFELIFEHTSKKTVKYVAPQYLPKELEDERKWEDLDHKFDSFKKPNLILQFKYFMPRYIMLRFLATYGKNAISRYYWKNGIAFTIDKCNVSVLSDYDQKQFRVFTENNNQYILRIIFDKLVQLTENANSLLVGIDGDNFVAYTALREEFPNGKFSENNNIKTNNGQRVPLSDFKHLFEDINILKQKHSDMSDSVSETKKIKIFISYAHDDNEPKKRVDLFVKELKGQLKALDDDYTFSIFKDEQILLGEDWNNRLQKEIAETDVAVLLLSSAFLQSEYITKNELGIFLENNKNNSTCILCPIYFDPFLYRKYEFLKKYQFFKPNGSTYGPKYEHLGDDLCYGDLIEFDPQSGIPLPNKSRMRYIIDFVEELERALIIKFQAQ
ncbi:MAG TPA: leucine-rich repeat domain-containing protein [Parafilimonas sp.]|nr:leucine-rich repeat domain-containing protein [Parafilimonas sp.]